MYHTAHSPHHGQHPHQQAAGRMPPGSPSYAPGPSSQQYASGSYYAPPLPPQPVYQPHGPPTQQRSPQPAPTAAVPHHSHFLKIHSYTPSSLHGPVGGELVVSCRLFPQATSPQTSNIIRLCFGSYPLATRVARNPQPIPPPQPMEPGQELLLRCDIPSWDELLDKGTVQPNEAPRVYLFCEVMRPNQVPGQPEHVLQRIWYGEFDYAAPMSHRRSQLAYPPPPPPHVGPSKRAGSPLASPRRRSPQYYHRQHPGYQDYEPHYVHGPGYGATYPHTASEYDRGFEVQVEGGYYHPENGYPHPDAPRHVRPSQPSHGHPPSALPHLITPTTPVYTHHPPSPTSARTSIQQTYQKQPQPQHPNGKPPLAHGHPAAGSAGLAWGPPPPSAPPTAILAPPQGAVLGPGEVSLPYSPEVKGPPMPPIRTQNLAAPGQLIRNLQPKSPKGVTNKKPKATAGTAAAAAAATNNGTTTTTTTTPGGVVQTTTTMKAKLELHGNLEAMALGWSRPEFENRRRLVQFWRKQVGATIEVAYKPVDQMEWQKDTIVISCIWRLEKNECYVTSVDTIYLLEAIIGNRFTVEEKNRIRRNLEGLKPDTISKNKEDTKDFFEVIMGFPDPKPRHIEKDVKVFKWEKLAEALTKIISKYSVAYNGPPPAAPPTNPIPGPLRAPPAEEGSGQIGTIPLPSAPPLPTQQPSVAQQPYHAPSALPPPPPQPSSSNSYNSATSQRDYSHPPSGSYPPEASPRTHGPSSYHSVQQHGSQPPQNSQSPADFFHPPHALPLPEASQGVLDSGASLQAATDMGALDYRPSGLSAPLNFDYSDYSSTETPPPAMGGPMPPVNAPNNPAASSSTSTAPAARSNLSQSTTVAPSDYKSPTRPTPPTSTVTTTVAIRSPTSASAPIPAELVDPANLRRPASEPPTIPDVDLQPSPFSTLSYDGVAIATPEPLGHALTTHELAGIGLDLGDSFDFSAVDSGAVDVNVDGESAFGAGAAHISR